MRSTHSLHSARSRCQSALACSWPQWRRPPSSAGVASRGASAIAMATAAIGCLIPLASWRLGALLVAWVLVSAGAQTVKITVDTVLQRSSPDDLRGRVFVAYDLVFNLAFVLGVTVLTALPLSVLDGALISTGAALTYASAAIAIGSTRGGHHPHAVIPRIDARPTTLAARLRPLPVREDHDRGASRAGIDKPHLLLARAGSQGSP